MLEGVGTLLVLLDVKLTITPPVGATCDSVAVKLPDVPRLTDVLVSDMLMTVTEDVALVKPGSLTVIVEVPAASVVTVTLAEVAFAANVTVAGTVAAAVLLELRLNV